MVSIWNKLDPGLSSVYSDYLRMQERGLSPDTPVHPIVASGSRLRVSLIFEGDLGEIEALGFATDGQEAPSLVNGLIDLADLERIAAHPAVRKLTYARPGRPMLDKSIPDIRANQVWQRAGTDFTGLTGEGTIVGIIDTGVDIHHPFLREPQPPNTSRILRIWDQGLSPAPGDRQPDPSFMSGSGSVYGVEYKLDQIMAAIGGLGNFRHRDCSGHGTHVASTAAGNGADKFKYIGVAPKAKLIIVKILYLLEDPGVDFDKRFRDAVTYILNVAKEDFANQPVSINYSIGSSLGPHDGLSLNEDFLTFRFSGQSRRCFVVSAGNEASTKPDGSVKFPQHARLDFPAGGGTIEVPFIFRDERRNRLEYGRCKGVDDTDSMHISLFYPNGSSTLSFELKVPLGPTGAGFPGGFAPGPPLGGEVGHDFGFGHHFSMKHSIEEDALVFTGRGTVKRNQLLITVDPFRKKHLADDNTYTLKVTSTEQITARVWCEQDSALYMFFVDPTATGGVTVEDSHQISAPGGAAGVITVAAYNAEAPGLPTTHFSSRGPLVDWDGTVALPDKPDIGAPGSTIDAARSRDMSPTRKKKHVVTESMGGTSMAAPHVTGAAALLLQKNPALTTTQIIETLSTHARRPAGETPEQTAKRKVELGNGRLDVKASIDNT